MLEHCNIVHPSLLFSREKLCLFLREKRITPFSLSSKGRFSRPLIVFIALLWSSPVCLHPSWTVRPRTVSSAPDAAWQGLSETIMSPSLLVMPLQMQPINLGCCSDTLMTPVSQLLGTSRARRGVSTVYRITHISQKLWLGTAKHNHASTQIMCSC